MDMQSVRESNHPFFQLNNQIHEQIDRPSWFTRYYRTISKVRNDHGYCAAAAITAAKVATITYASIATYFLIKGCVYTFMEINEDRLSQGWGDIGGWLTLPIISFYSISKTLNFGFREAEYRKLSSFCKEWHLKASEKGQFSVEDFYVQINHILDTVSAQCLTNKTVISRKLKALEIIQDFPKTNINPDSELSLDLKLKDLYVEVEIEKKKTSKNFFSRLLDGVKNNEITFSHQSKVSKVISGIALPIFLVFNAACSAIGEPILCFKLMVTREDLPEYGHAGEWPDNLLTSLIVAYWLANDLIVVSDLQDAVKQFQPKLTQLNQINTLALHNRLCETANNELQLIASGRTFNNPAFFNYFQRKSSSDGNNMEVSNMQEIEV